MNRRGFFFFITGGLLARGVNSCYIRSFPPEKILEIDEEGIVHDRATKIARTEIARSYMLSYDPKSRSILRVTMEQGPFPSK